MPLGYSSGGRGARVRPRRQEFKPGDRVACVAPHAGIVSVGRNLVRAHPGRRHLRAGRATPRSAPSRSRAFAWPASRSGERVLVIGLGLIGQIAVCLLKAQGCRVFGIDLDPAKLKLARELGADAAEARSSRDAVLAFSDIRARTRCSSRPRPTATSPSSSLPRCAGPKGRIVLVGVAGLNLPRPPFFQKELEFTVSVFARAGPRATRPTRRRASTTRSVRPLDGAAEHAGGARHHRRREAPGRALHHAPLARSSAPSEAYDLITSRARAVHRHRARVPGADQRPVPPDHRSGAKRLAERSGVSMIGAGNFARLILMPILSRLSGFELRGLATAKGMNAEHSGRSMGFAFATTDVEECSPDPDTHAVFIATRHDLHAELVIQALEAGKHVFVEKPLCIRPEELDRIAPRVDEARRQVPAADGRLQPSLRARDGGHPGSLPRTGLRSALRSASRPAPFRRMRGRRTRTSAAAASSARPATPSIPAPRSSAVRPFGSSPSRRRRSAESRPRTTGSSSRFATRTAASPTSRTRPAATERVPRSASRSSAAVAPRLSRAGTNSSSGLGRRSSVVAVARTRATQPNSRPSSRACRSGGEWPIPWEHLLRRHLGLADGGPEPPRRSCHRCRRTTE